MALDRLFNLGLDGIKIERGRCLHRRILDSRLCQLNNFLLHVDEPPKLEAHEIVEITCGALIKGLALYRRRPLERVLAYIDWSWHVRRVLLSRPTIRLLD